MFRSWVTGAVAFVLMVDVAYFASGQFGGGPQQNPPCDKGCTYVTWRWSGGGNGANPCWKFVDTEVAQELWSPLVDGGTVSCYSDPPTLVDYDSSCYCGDRLCFASRNGEKIFGFEAQEMAGGTCYEVIKQAVYCDCAGSEL